MLWTSLLKKQKTYNYEHYFDDNPEITIILVCDRDYCFLCHLLNTCVDEIKGRVHLDGTHKLKV